MDGINLEDLPEELLLQICSFLDGDDVGFLASVSRKFREITYCERIWKTLCYRDYNVEFDNNEENVTARNLYTRILRPFGFMVGLWQMSVKHFGGLAEIHYENGQLVAFELFAPYFLGWRHPLKSKKLFSISFDSNEERVVILHSRGKEGKLRLVKRNDLNAFNFSLLKSEKPFESARKQEEEFVKWLLEQGYGPLTPGYDPEDDNPNSLLSMFLTKANYWHSCTFRRIKGLPKQKPIYPIQPGLFKSVYDIHGPELIMLTYADDEPKATAVKITGDPNVPAGKVTFFANLNYPLTNLSWEEQESCDRLILVKAENVPYSHQEYLNTPPKVFRAPEDLVDDFDEPLPEITIGRFQGLCQLANYGYKDPCFSKGHWVIFDHDTFGFIFLEIYCISIYYRVTEMPISQYA